MEALQPQTLLFGAFALITIIAAPLLSFWLNIRRLRASTDADRAERSRRQKEENLREFEIERRLKLLMEWKAECTRAKETERDAFRKDLEELRDTLLDKMHAFNDAAMRDRKDMHTRLNDIDKQTTAVASKVEMLLNGSKS